MFIWSQTSPVVLCLKNSVIITSNTSLYGSQTSPVHLCTQKSMLATRINSLYGSQTTPVDLWMQNSVLSTRMTSLNGFQASPVVLWMQNRDFRNRITSINGSQTSPVVLCMQNSVLSIRITSLYGSQPSSVVFEGKTVNLGPESQVSMCPSPHLWIFHSKQRAYHKNYKSLCVPALTCGFFMRNSVLNIRNTSLYWSQPSSVVFESKTVNLGPELQVSMGPSPHRWIFHAKQRV